MKKTICGLALLLVACSRPRPSGTFYYPDTPRAKEHFDPGQPPSLVTVAAAAEPPEVGKLPPPVRVKSVDEALSEINGALEDVYFPYDRSDLTPDALTVLRRDASLLCAILAEFPGLKVIIEGHCDERGSAEYNLGLGDRRARRAEAILHENGVPAGTVEVVSFGKEAPQCTEPSEACYQRNRRAHMAVKR